MLALQVTTSNDRFIDLIESALVVSKYPFTCVHMRDFLMMDLMKINGRFLCNNSKDTQIDPILASVVAEKALKYHAHCY